MGDGQQPHGAVAGVVGLLAKGAAQAALDHAEDCLHLPTLSIRFTIELLLHQPAIFRRWNVIRIVWSPPIFWWNDGFDA